MTSRYRTALFFLTLVIASISAKAQIAVYGNVESTSYSPNYASSFWTYGPNAGLYYNFLHLGPVTLGGDLRANYLFSEHYTYRSALIGPRVLFKTPGPLHPYAQFSFGVGGANGSTIPNVQTRWVDKFHYTVIGGVDMRLTRRFDLRPIEVGYGRMSQGSGFHDSIVTVGSGVVFHFNLRPKE